jgi:hypothetical protein
MSNINGDFSTFKLRQMGVLPRYIDCEQKDALDEGRIKEIPFSKEYNTYDEYLNDKLIAFQYFKEDKDIPDELYTKMKSTADQLRAEGYKI